MTSIRDNNAEAVLGADDWTVQGNVPEPSNQFERWTTLTAAAAVDIYDRMISEGYENVRIRFGDEHKQP